MGGAGRAGGVGGAGGAGVGGGEAWQEVELLRFEPFQSLCSTGLDLGLMGGSTAL